MYCPEYDDPANCAAEEDQYRQAGDLYGKNMFIQALSSYKLTCINNLNSTISSDTTHRKIHL